MKYSQGRSTNILKQFCCQTLKIILFATHSRKFMENLAFALFYVGYVVLTASGQEQPVSVQIDNSQSLKDYGVPFDALMVIHNTGKSLMKDVSIKYILSRTATIKIITVNNESTNQNTSTQVLVEELAVSQKISVKLTVLLHAEHVSAGYHVDNIMFDIKWTTSGVPSSSGYKTIYLPYIVPGCDTIFDVTNKVLRRDQVSATSYYVTSSPQEFGENSTGWCAKEFKQEYLQILFTNRVRITSIRTASRTGKKNWVEEYRIKCKTDGEWWDHIENGNMLFKGYLSMAENAHPWFLHPLECDALRIIPTKWSGALICARFLIKGCYIAGTDTCSNPIGMENKQIPDTSLSDLSPGGGVNSSQPEDGRLNAKITKFPHGWSGNLTSQDWLQIDLGSLFKITRLAIQGGYAQPMSVKSLHFWYSNDSFNTWDRISLNTSGISTIFQGPQEEGSKDLVSLISLKKPIVGRSFRIEPLSFEHLKVLRTEMYGCPVKTLTMKEETGEMKELPSRTILVDEVNGKLYICQRNLRRSSCYKVEETNGFRKWTGLPKNILNIVAMDSNNNRYATTKQGTFMIQKTGNDTWMDISRDTLFERENNDEHLIRSVDIPLIFPNVKSESLTWTLKNKRQIAASGRGLFTRETNLSPWKQIASWSCCGM